MRKKVSLALALLAAGVAQAADLQVSLGSQPAASGKDVEVTVNYRNTGKETLHVYRWYLPSGELQEPILQVSRDGKAVTYLGARYKRVAPSLKDTVALPPGASLSAKVKVSEFYDLSQAGKLSVSFQADSDRVLNRGLPVGVSAKSASAAAPLNETLRSNVLTLDSPAIGSPLLQKAKQAQSEWSVLARSAASSVSYANCSVKQQQDAAAGIGAASAMANESTAYLSGAPSGTPRYTTWFGKYSQANWNTAKAHFLNIKDALDAKPVSIDCGCSKPGVFAYVYPAQPYKVYLCDAYWTAPTKGTDSKGGTLVHELSHFTVVAGTDDHVYGQSGAKNLAKTNPAQALNNADNHEYFAENTPGQP